MAVSLVHGEGYAFNDIVFVPETRMSNIAPFVILHQAPDVAAGWAADSLGEAGFSTLRTFDLQAARRAHLDCPCPHHGQAKCTCQMVVLLVYTGNYPPATLVIHGSDDTSYFYLINLPEQSAGQQLEVDIRHSLDGFFR